MKRFALTLIGTIIIASGALAQQRAGYSNFLLNDYYFNPAIAGSKNVHTANLAYRNQWAGFEGAPTLMIGNFQGSVKNEGKMGYGLSLVSERKGITQNTAIYLNYAHHFKLSEKLKLGLGIQPGYIQHRVRLYDAQVADAGDDVLTGTVYSANALDVSTGFHLYSEKFFLMGSAHRILGKSIQFTSFNSNLALHLNGIIGYSFHIKTKAKKIFELQPSFMARYAAPVPFQYTAMLKGTFDKKMWLGVLYRSNDAIGISAGVTLRKRFSIGYGYDYTLFKMSNYQSGSHEVMLSFVITKDKPSLAEEDENLNNSILEEMQKKLDEEKKNKNK
ncbi:MAG: type IX secretion system membrane protein PorP/SprF [Crocinitomicaceae bacterium]|nr:type IX secretion system membrane protein PorP/SprF [Crocinitomicaceae bacterium]